MINNEAFLYSKKTEKNQKKNRTTVCDKRLIDLELEHTMNSHFNLTFSSKTT